MKVPASERVIDQESGKQLLKEVFQFLKETPHTVKLYEELLQDLRKETNYVDWFATLIHRLFRGTGLILMDAGDGAIRELEKPFFQRLIENNDMVRGAFMEGATSFQEAGFGVPIDMDKNNAHLFFHVHGQRILLEKVDGRFREKNGKKSWTEQELSTLLEKDPSLFSNNVVTRPIMQDYVLPVISFIAGPGELKYWGVLKGVFHLFEMTMPLVSPRVHISFISRRTEKNLHWLETTPKTVLERGMQQEKEMWLKRNNPYDVDGIFHEARESVVTSLANLSKSFPDMGKSGEQLHAKFENHFLNTMLEYEKGMNKLIRKRNEAGILKFDETEIELRPNGHLQERYLNIIPFLNMHGEDLIQRVVDRISTDETPLYGKELYIYL